MRAFCVNAIEKDHIGTNIRTLVHASVPTRSTEGPLRGPSRGKQTQRTKYTNGALLACFTRSSDF